MEEDGEVGGGMSTDWSNHRANISIFFFLLIELNL